MEVSYLLTSMVCMFGGVLAQNNPAAQHHQPQHGQHGQGNVLKDRNTVHDQQHIMEHMDGVYKKPEDQMTDQELQFHYFKLHDYDNNNMLDGIELVSAITHFHKEDDDNPNHPPPPVLPESQIISMIDTILLEEDRNNDGYISYIEFIQAQRGNDKAP